jgi:nitrate/nitrite-specific signal transduction histidine kinase
MRELELYSFTVGKASVVHRRAQQELKQYASIGEDIERQTESIRSELQTLKALAVEEQGLRKQREECESLSKMVNQLPSREETRRAIEACESDRGETVRKADVTAERMALYSRQFHLLMRAVFDVKSQLAEEDEEDQAELKASAAAAAGESKGGGSEIKDVDMDSASAS